MPDGNQLAPTANHDLATMRFEDALEVYSPNFAAVLPTDVPLEHFKRMVVTAVNQNPDLRYADRRTLFNSCVKCASDGVLPDGREAALVVFKTKIKDREGKEHWIDAVNYMIMVAGIRKRLRNTGEVLSAEAEVVYANDHFRFRLGDNAMIEHEPAGLDQEPGNVVGAYAIIKLTNGEVLREIVRLKDVERARGASRAPNSPAWKDWFDQMARKVALRRCAKAAPSSSGTMRAAQALERLLARDEEQPELPAPEELPMIPPRPRREDFIEMANEEPAPPSFEVVDFFGDIRQYATEMEATEVLAGLICGAKSVRSLDGLLESNHGLVQCPSIIAAYKDHKEALAKAAEAGKVSQVVSQVESPEPRLEPAGPEGERPAREVPAPGGGPAATEHPEGVAHSTPTERSTAQELPAAREATPTAANTPSTTPNERSRDEANTLAVDMADYKRAGQLTDWDAMAAKMEATIAVLVEAADAAPNGRFIQQNRGALEGMRTGNRAAWSTVNYRLNDRYRALKGGEP